MRSGLPAPRMPRRSRSARKRRKAAGLLGTAGVWVPEGAFESHPAVLALLLFISVCSNKVAVII